MYTVAWPMLDQLFLQLSRTLAGVQTVYLYLIVEFWCQALWPVEVWKLLTVLSMQGPRDLGSLCS